MKGWSIVILRGLVGGFFLLSGAAKLRLHPAEVDAYVRAYEVIPFGYTYPVALLLPWIEVISGGLLIAGILPFYTASFIMAILLLFIILLLSVIVRGIPIEDCGCLPGLIQETPWTALIRDVILMAMAIPVWNHYRRRREKDG